ncbi:MAG TPA: sigma-70 family RNA polymerase sigma factor [Kofleriaceae bacterium]|nr:sigma-70 family RNA polymerase sigma factor [Kofleriaceae bacterium]
MLAPNRTSQPDSLLGRVAAGDPAAVRACLAQYGNLVWSIARRFEPSDAEDAVQEIFLDIWRSAGGYDPARGSEATFVATITRRRLIDRRRMRARRPSATEQVADLELEAPNVPPDTTADAAKAADALGQLRPEQRRVLVLATAHGMSHGEIAAQTGMPLGTIKAHVRRGLISIRNALLGVQQGEP